MSQARYGPQGPGQIRNVHKQVASSSQLSSPLTCRLVDVLDARPDAWYIAQIAMHDEPQLSRDDRRSVEPLEIPERVADMFRNKSDAQSLLDSGEP